MHDKLVKLLDEQTDASKAARAIINLFKDEGYIYVPTGKNVTITTGDNEGGKLMTEQEWREEFNG